MNRELLDLAAELHRRHRPFVIATVVWARGPSSGKQGATAIIEGDQTVHGWIGGACAAPAVLREARRVLNDGESRLMYLGPAEELDGSARDGVLTVPISCSSEGAMEVFMEPVLPRPHVIVIGGSPMVRTLCRLLVGMDWRTSVVDEGGRSFGEDVTVVPSVAAIDELGVTDTTAVVVATQGEFDEPALEAALATTAPYIGLVASARRAETVMGYLRDRGHDAESLRRIHTPAGLDLGRIEHREIAVAVLGELVAIKATGGFGGAPHHEAKADQRQAIDPVCGMTVEIAGARFVTEHGGESHFFCCPGCQKTFEEQLRSKQVSGD